MFRKLITKKRALVLGAVAMLAVAGIAIAYFTSTGSGTGHGTVGTSTAFSVTPADPTGTMYPGEGSSTITYSVTNPGPASQVLHKTTATVASEDGNITQGGVAVVGCKASWFEANNTSPAEQDLAAGKSASGSVEVKLKDEAESQDACKEAKPDITINAS